MWWLFLQVLIGFVCLTCFSFCCTFLASRLLRRLLLPVRLALLDYLCDLVEDHLQVGNLVVQRIQAAGQCPHGRAQGLDESARDLGGLGDGNDAGRD